MSKHTPGPWSTQRALDGSGDVGITAPGVRNVIAECFAAMRHRDERATDEAEANARLIASAPELLAACEAVLAVPADEIGRVSCLVPQIVAAVRKARDTPSA